MRKIFKECYANSPKIIFLFGVLVFFALNAYYHLPLKEVNKSALKVAELIAVADDEGSTGPCSWGYREIENCFWSWTCRSSKWCDCTDFDNMKDGGDNTFTVLINLTAQVISK